MENQRNYTTSFVVSNTPHEVFEAIQQVGQWWQGEIQGKCEKMGDEFTYQMGDMHFSRQKVVDMDLDKKVVWLVAESIINFVDDKQEWDGTRIIFELSEEGEQTRLDFTHEGLSPQISCYKDCTSAWDAIIGKSLFSYITTGKGMDVFN